MAYKVYNATKEQLILSCLLYVDSQLLSRIRGTFNAVTPKAQIRVYLKASISSIQKRCTGVILIQFIDSFFA